MRPHRGARKDSDSEPLPHRSGPDSGPLPLELETYQLHTIARSLLCASLGKGRGSPRQALASGSSAASLSKLHGKVSPNLKWKGLNGSGGNLVPLRAGPQSRLEGPKCSARRSKRGPRLSRRSHPAPDAQIQRQDAQETQARAL